MQMWDDLPARGAVVGVTLPDGSKKLAQGDSEDDAPVRRDRPSGRVAEHTGVEDDRIRWGGFWPDKEDAMRQKLSETESKRERIMVKREQGQAG